MNWRIDILRLSRTIARKYITTFTSFLVSQQVGFLRTVFLSLKFWKEVPYVHQNWYRGPVLLSITRTWSASMKFKIKLMKVRGIDNKHLVFKLLIFKAGLPNFGPRDAEARPLRMKTLWVPCCDIFYIQIQVEKWLLRLLVRGSFVSPSHCFLINLGNYNSLRTLYWIVRRYWFSITPSGSIVSIFHFFCSLE